ncbi:hypothetical protein BGW80DRAFT_1372434 [Lactifluus volemus]|nr:hypothetical protein BGW80DRAFT_1372434 [Lactifluus volemus]
MLNLLITNWAILIGPVCCHIAARTYSKEHGHVRKTKRGAKSLRETLCRLSSSRRKIACTFASQNDNDLMSSRRYAGSCAATERMRCRWRRQWSLSISDSRIFSRITSFSSRTG